jgi:hypothetical protein
VDIGAAGNTIALQGAFNVAQTTTLTGAAALSSTLAVAGAATFSADTTLTGAAATLVSTLTLSSNNAVDISSAAQAIVKTVEFVSTSHATKQRNLPDTSVLSGVQQK